MKVKTMLIVFFNAKGIVHKEFVPQGQTIVSTYLYGRARQIKKKSYPLSKRDRRYLATASQQHSARPEV